MVSSSTPFSDIQNHWARSFITGLAQLEIVSGLPNGTYRPDNSLTRAEFAAILAKAFPTDPKKRQYVPFVDVPSSHWAAAAIQAAYEKGFISGFPDKTFRLGNRITRTEVLVSLVAGLEIATKVKPDLVSKLGQIYQDAVQIPNYAKNQIAIATSAGLVVNYPNLKLLNPNLAATRADVAVIIYQALVYLDLADKIASSYLVIPPTPTTTPTPTPIPTTSVKLNHTREFRGVWVSCVWNGDWPSKAGLSVEQQKAELVEITNKLQALNFNALIFQVRPEGDALYESQIEPWSAWLTGTQGKAPEPFYDPLAFAIAECHKRNIELHAWFNPYRASTSTNPAKTVRPHIAVTNPESVYLWGSQRWMDPGLKVVQDRAYNVIIDVLKRYDIDGVHLDDYFYPYPIENESFPDSKTYAAYKAAGGTLSLSDWRRDNVNKMVLRLSEGIKATKPQVKFGISPFGIYRPGQPPGITGLDAYNQLYADSKKWLEQGWIDYIAPQLYWRTDQAPQSYSALLKWWTDINIKQRHVYAGNNLTEPSNKSRESEEIEKQVKISRSQASRLSLGNIFFNLDILRQNSQGIADGLETLYNRPALPPPMSWRDTTPPPPPTGLQVNNRKLTWQPGDDQPIRSWTLYRQTGDTWTIQRILPAGVTFFTVSQAGTYAVCAVDRLANESLGAAIAVS